jgi:hypothetical protein
MRPLCLGKVELLFLDAERGIRLKLCRTKQCCLTEVLVIKLAEPQISAGASPFCSI